MNMHPRLPLAAHQRFARWPALLLLALASSGPTWAQKPPNVTDGELALLPVYCPDTQGFNYGDAYTNTSPRAAGWVAKLGPSFWALHHHCWGLIKVRRAMAPGVSPAIRTGLIKAAIADYNYVINHSNSSFLVLPDIYLKMGEAYRLLGDLANAALAYGQSRRLKPDFWPAYAGWAEALHKSGARAAALTHLEEGLRQAPTAQPLQQQYQQYGGDLKTFMARLPAPAASAPSTAASAPVAQTPSASAPAVATPPAEPASR